MVYTRESRFFVIAQINVGMLIAIIALWVLVFAVIGGIIWVIVTLIHRSRRRHQELLDAINRRE